MTEWLTITPGTAPVIVSIPHAGTAIPADIAETLHSLPRARHDADLYIDRLYAFAADLGATIVRTALSRTVIDVNRDPAGVSLYPGQTTTGLCPTETFDGAPLYRAGQAPDETEIARRRAVYFQPYHDALAAEIARLRRLHPAVVLYEAHSIRSHVPRLFDGALPQFNIGTNSGASCHPALTAAISEQCGPSQIIDGRFKGGWTTRHYGDPAHGVHAVQMELAMRGYLDESLDWPPPWDPVRAAPLQHTLTNILAACIAFAKRSS